jgi:hypothetical protein
MFLQPPKQKAKKDNTKNTLTLKSKKKCDLKKNQLIF